VRVGHAKWTCAAPARHIGHAEWKTPDEIVGSCSVVGWIVSTVRLVHRHVHDHRALFMEATISSDEHRGGAGDEHRADQKVARRDTADIELLDTSVMTGVKESPPRAGGRD